MQPYYWTAVQLSKVPAILCRQMDSRSPLAQFISDRLNERQETPERFARRVDVNSSGLYRFLRGESSELRQSTLRKIAAGLGLTPAELLQAAEPDESGSPVSSLAVDARRAALIDIVRDHVPEDHLPALERMLSGYRVRRKLNAFGLDEDGLSVWPGGSNVPQAAAGNGFLLDWLRMVFCGHPSFGHPPSWGQESPTPGIDAALAGSAWSALPAG